MSILRSVLAAKKVDAKPSRKGQNVAAPVAESGRKPAAKKTGTKPTGASPNDVGQAGLRLRDRFRVVRLDAPKVTGPADAMLAAAIVALVAFGVVMVYSASAVFASQQYGNGQHFLIRQGIFAAVGLFVMVAVAKVDYHRYRKLTYLGLIFAIALLFAVILGFGRSAGGATRWISLGFINIQPAEIAKVIFIFWLAYSLSKKSDKIRSFSVGFLPHVMVAGLLMLLCLKQPDFGSAVMIALLTGVLLFISGTRVGYLIGAVTITAPVVFYLVTSREYRMNRIRAFLDPFADRHGNGYQISESLMSFGSGGVGGVGIGDSRQKLFFLPEAHTDFISAIIGEELGLVGVAFLILAFVIIVWRGLRAGLRAADDYGTYLGVGITLFIGFQALTNLSVAMGLLPTKGLVLPFVSYGGSALLVNCAAVGVLLNISRPREVDESAFAAEAATRKEESRRRRAARKHGRVLKEDPA